MSNGASEISPQTLYACQMFATLDALLRKRYISFFSISNNGAKNKYLGLCLVKEATKHIFVEAFQKIKNKTHEKSIHILREIDQRLRIELFFAF